MGTFTVCILDLVPYLYLMMSDRENDRPTTKAGQFDIEKLAEQIDKLLLISQDHSARLDRIQGRQERHAQSFGYSEPDQASNRSSPFTPAHFAMREALSPGAAATEDIGDIQSTFQNIKDNIQGIRLPNDHKLQDSRSGIKRQDQTAFNNLSKCGRYVETGLKLLFKLKEPPEDPNVAAIFQDIYVVLLANLRYLQDEYSALLVSGTVNQETARIFRALNRNTSGFTADAIQNIQHAAAVVAASNQSEEPDRSTQRSTSFNRFQGRRGQFTNQTSWHRGRDMSRDVYHNMSRSAPGIRPNVHNQDNQLT